jgi:hypothetical protein
MNRSARLAPTPARARSLASVAFVALVTLVVAACRSGGASPSASARSVASAPASEQAPSSTPAISLGSAIGQTDTDWGRIWDTLPDGFPSVPGATTADEGATGPASANLAVPGTDAKGVTTQLQAALTQAGFRTLGLSGPLENGGYVLDMSGSPAGCKLQVAVTPTGSLTSVTILYGAGCAHD